MYDLYNLAILKPNYDISCDIDKEIIKKTIVLLI